MYSTVNARVICLFMLAQCALFVVGGKCDPCFNPDCKLSRPSSSSSQFYFGAGVGMSTCLNIQKSIDRGSISASECNNIRRVTRTSSNRCLCRNRRTGKLCNAPLSAYPIFQAPRRTCKANGKTCKKNSNCCSKRCSKGSKGKKRCKKASKKFRRDLSVEDIDHQVGTTVKSTRLDFDEIIDGQRIKHLRSRII